MKENNNQGYATLLVLIVLGIISIIIFGVLHIYSIHFKITQSNQHSTKAYYLAESGIRTLKFEIDSIFEGSMDYFFDKLEDDFQTEPLKFQEFVLSMEELVGLEKRSWNDNIFEFYPTEHGWVSEVSFQSESITLYVTGYYMEARKRIVAVISYPELIFNETDNNSADLLEFVSSEILLYYQGYEGEVLE